MKQQKVYLAVLVVISLATVWWMRDSLLKRLSSQKEMLAAPLIQPSTRQQQMAVETAPVPAAPAALAPLAAPQTAPVELPAAAITGSATMHETLSYIGFISLTDNYNFRDGEISWRAYREYRHSRIKASY